MGMINLRFTGTLILVKRNYNRFLIKIVKVPQPDLQASVDVRQSFLQVDRWPC